MITMYIQAKFLDLFIELFNDVENFSFKIAASLFAKNLN